MRSRRGRSRRRRPKGLGRGRAGRRGRLFRTSRRSEGAFQLLSNRFGPPPFRPLMSPLALPVDDRLTDSVRDGDYAGAMSWHLTLRARNRSRSWSLGAAGLRPLLACVARVRMPSGRSWFDARNAPLHIDPLLWPPEVHPVEPSAALHALAAASRCAEYGHRKWQSRLSPRSPSLPAGLVVGDLFGVHCP